MNKLRNYIAAAFSMLILLPTMILLFDRGLPLDINYIDLSPRIVNPGGEVTVKWVAIKHRHFGDGIFECKGTYVRRIVDSLGTIVETPPQELESAKMLKDDLMSTQSKKIAVPMLAPGPATYQITTTYWCNPLQIYFPIVHKESLIHFTIQGSKVLTEKMTVQTFPVMQ